MHASSSPALPRPAPGAQMPYMQHQPLQQCPCGPASLERESDVPVAVVMAATEDVHGRVQAAVVQGYEAVAHLTNYLSGTPSTRTRGFFIWSPFQRRKVSRCLPHVAMTRCTRVHTPGSAAAPHGSCCMYSTNETAVRRDGMSLDSPLRRLRRSPCATARHEPKDGG